MVVVAYHNHASSYGVFACFAKRFGIGTVHLHVVLREVYEGKGRI